MKAAIMQPTYIPWVGYFALIEKVDIFVFLDDVKIERRSWHVRNKILVQGREKFLTIPVVGSNEQILKNVKIDTSRDWAQKHLRTWEQSYAGHPYSKDILKMLNEVFCDNKKENTLSEITSGIIIKLARKLKISTEFLFSSNLNADGKKSKKLVNILKKINCDYYISPIGSKEYIEEEGIFQSERMSVEYHNYVPAVYPQIGSKEFIPFLSVADLIANVGFEAAKGYI
jgi:hypothetical protein